MGGLFAKVRSFVRYKVTPQAFLEGMQPNEKEMIRAHTFKGFVREVPEDENAPDLAEQNVKKQVTGWVDFEGKHDLVDTGDYTLDGRIIALSLRVDSRNVPPSLLDQEIAKVEQKRLKDMGRDFLTRVEREEIRQSCFEALIVKALVTTKIHNVIYDLQREEVLFFSTSNSAMKAFEWRFQSTFGVTLHRVTSALNDKFEYVPADLDTRMLSRLWYAGEKGAKFGLADWVVLQKEDKRVAIKKPMAESREAYSLLRDLYVPREIRLFWDGSGAGHAQSDFAFTLDHNHFFKGVKDALNVTSGDEDLKTNIYLRYLPLVELFEAMDPVRYDLAQSSPEYLEWLRNATATEVEQ